MSVTARVNGWRGFEGIGEKIHDSQDRIRWEYRCDGMPSYFGCPATLVRSVRIGKVGPIRASGGWTAMYGTDGPGEPGDDGKGNDLDVVLVFCPTCTKVVEKQMKDLDAERDSK